MYSVSSAIYEDIAKNLIEQIGESSYFSSSIDLSFIDDKGSDIECRMVASLIIYRTISSMPEGDMEVISNIVPVWFEFHTIVEMEEEINDFDIYELKNYICAWI